MREKILRVRIPDELYKRYKILCVHRDLSLPKQSIELINNFVDVQEKNYAILEALKK